MRRDTLCDVGHDDRWLISFSSFFSDSNRLRQVTLWVSNKSRTNAAYLEMQHNSGHYSALFTLYSLNMSQLWFIFCVQMFTKLIG